MEKKTNINVIYKPSDNVIAREVQGEFIIIPITSGIADTEDELFSLNDTGKVIWKKLDGKRTLNDIVKDLSSEFKASCDELKKDVLGLTQELFKRKMVVEVSKE